MTLVVPRVEVITPGECVYDVTIDDSYYQEKLRANRAPDRPYEQIFGYEVYSEKSKLTPSYKKYMIETMGGLVEVYGQRAVDVAIGVSDGEATKFQSLQNARLKKIADWLHRHVEHFMAEEDEMRSANPSLIDDFRKRLYKYDYIDGRVIDFRLGNTTFSFFDSLHTMLIPQARGSNSRISGQYNSVMSESSVCLTKDPQNPRELTASHEALHVVSGREQSMIDRTASGDKSEIVESRLGLRFQSEQGELTYTWLNEALTEYINIDLYGHPGYQASYPTERDLFGELRFSGKYEIDRALFIKAYFENHDPENGNPAWQEVQNELEKSYGFDILAKLEEMIGSHEDPGYHEGLEKAIKYLNYLRKNNTDNIPSMQIA